MEHKITLSAWTLSAFHDLFNELSRDDIMDVLSELQCFYDAWLDDDLLPEPEASLSDDALAAFNALELLIDRDMKIRKPEWCKKLPLDLKEARRVTVCLDDSTLRHLRIYALNKGMTVSKAINWIVYKTIWAKGVSHVDFVRDRNDVKRKPQRTTLRPATLALVEQHRKNVDYSTFIRGVIESFFGI